MIGLDLGTTNCKAVLLDAERRVRAVATDSYKLQIPHPRAAELDVRQVWEAAKKVLRAVADSAPVPTTVTRRVITSGAGRKHEPPFVLGESNCEVPYYH